MKKRVFCTVTNDLNYDQRMIRICTSLASAGFSVTLVGREDRGSLPLALRPYRQHRLKMWTRRGKLFYLEYHFRLFFYLLGRKMDVLCAVDLDSILPCYFVSQLRRIPRLYDAHELFCEMKEVVSRPFIHRVWKAVERFAVPSFRRGIYRQRADCRGIQAVIWGRVCGGTQSAGAGRGSRCRGWGGCKAGVATPAGAVHSIPGGCERRQVFRDPDPRDATGGYATAGLRRREFSGEGPGVGSAARLAGEDHLSRALSGRRSCRPSPARPGAGSPCSTGGV